MKVEVHSIFLDFLTVLFRIALFRIVFPEITDVGYLVDITIILSPNSCNPTRSYNSSRSNIASNNVNSIFDNNNNNNNELDLVSIYPNPAQNNIHITSSNPEALKQCLVGIFNIQGAQIMEYQYQNKDIIKLDVTELSNGIYIIKMKTKKNIIVKKFIKQ